MVDEQLGIHAKQPIQEILAAQRHTRHVAHCEHVVLGKPASRAATNAPEIGERTVVPQPSAITHLIEFGNAHPVGIGRHVLGFDVHCDFSQIHICANARSCSDSGARKHIANHGHGKLVSRHAVGVEIACGIDKHLVD